MTSAFTLTLMKASKLVKTDDMRRFPIHFPHISFLIEQKQILIGCSWSEIVTHEMLNVAKYLLVRKYLKDILKY